MKEMQKKMVGPTGLFLALWVLCTLGAGLCPAGITSDDFSGSTLNPAWIVEDPGAPSDISLTGDGWLRVIIAAGRDIWINNRGGGVYLLTDPPNKDSYFLETFVNVGAGGSIAPSSMGGLVLVDSDQPTQFPFELTWGYAHGVELLLQNPGSTHTRVPLAGEAVFLRLERDGIAGTWTALYKVEESDPWIEGFVVPDSALPGGGSVDLQVGLFIKTWGGSTEATIDFDYYGSPSQGAVAPIPENEVLDVPRDTVLAWTPAESTVTRNVYFGTVYDDVNDAGLDNALGVLVSENQDPNTYDPEGLLAFGQTYYWRVDEVNGAPDFTVFPGDVWSFTAEPFSYPLTDVTATASSANPGNMGPENTVNGSGLNELDQHSAQGTEMWLSAPGDADIWIQYAFDRAYKLDQMMVWNSNQLIEAFVGLGVKEVTVEVSTDGENWSAIPDVPALAQAPGTPTYTANSTIEFNGTLAQYVRLNVESGYGPLGQYGLSEVRFFFIPTFPREPQPAEGAVTENVDVGLKWRAGREAAEHEVYLGTNADALAVVATTSERSYNAMGLDYDQTYFWQIIEVNAAEDPPAYVGDIWSFTTPPYLAIDGFDQYNDDCNRIFFAWEDGLGHNGGTDIEDCDVLPSNGNGGGSIVGNASSPFAEQSIVRSGRQSMPLLYDNNFGVSETTLQLDGQDWTTHGIKSLSLFFYGTANNTGQLYLKINNSKVVYNGAADDTTRAVWQPWIIDLSTVGGDLANVGSLTLGVDGASAAGQLYIDDIRLYPKTPEYVTPREPDNAGLLGAYALEGDATDSSSNGHHGAIEGGVTFAAGVTGQASEYNGIDALIDCGDVPMGDAGMSVAFWVQPRNIAQNWAGYVSKWTADNGQRTFWLGQHATDGWLRFGIYPTGATAETFVDSGQVILANEEWTHIACTYDGHIQRIYAHGIEVVASADRNAGIVDRGGELRLGKVATANWFDGLIDEVQVFSRALAVEEIAWLAGKTTAVAKPFD